MNGSRMSTVVGPVTETRCHDWLTYALLDWHGQTCDVEFTSETTPDGVRYSLSIGPSDRSV